MILSPLPSLRKDVFLPFDEMEPRDPCDICCLDLSLGFMMFSDVEVGKKTVFSLPLWTEGVLTVLPIWPSHLVNKT